MFKALLISIAPKWKQFKSSTSKWINRYWQNHTIDMKIRKNDLLTNTT